MSLPGCSHFQWDDVEQALKMERSKEEIRKVYIDPIMKQMTSELDSRAINFAYQNTNHIAGVLGYELDVEAAGFRMSTSRNNVVTIGQPATIIVSLEVGSLSEQVQSVRLSMTFSEQIF